MTTDPAELRVQLEAIRSAVRQRRAAVIGRVADPALRPAVPAPVLSASPAAGETVPLLVPVGPFPGAVGVPAADPTGNRSPDLTV